MAMPRDVNRCRNTCVDRSARNMGWGTSRDHMVGTWLAPVLVQGLIPNLRGPVEIVAVVLPIVAFFIRFHVGRRVISTNHCRTEIRRFQYVTLCLGALVLVLVDAVLILTNIMPKGLRGLLSPPWVMSSYGPFCI